jgi:hypothetical protein
MKRVTFSLLVALASGLILPGGARVAVAQESEEGSSRAVRWEATIPRLFTIEACGEVIEVRGTLSMEQVEVVSESGHRHFAWHVKGEGEGIGKASGARYLWRDSQMIVDNLAANGEFPYTGHYSFKSRLIGQGRARNYEFTMHFHTTVNANGEVTAEVGTGDETCR